MSRQTCPPREGANARSFGGNANYFSWEEKAGEGSAATSEAIREQKKRREGFRMGVLRAKGMGTGGKSRRAAVVGGGDA